MRYKVWKQGCQASTSQIVSILARSYISVLPSHVGLHSTRVLPVYHDLQFLPSLLAVCFTNHAASALYKRHPVSHVAWDLSLQARCCRQAAIEPERISMCPMLIDPTRIISALATGNTPQPGNVPGDPPKSSWAHSPIWDVMYGAHGCTQIERQKQQGCGAQVAGTSRVVAFRFDRSISSRTTFCHPSTPSPSSSPSPNCYHPSLLVEGYGAPHHSLSSAVFRLSLWVPCPPGH